MSRSFAIFTAAPVLTATAVAASAPASATASVFAKSLQPEKAKEQRTTEGTTSLRKRETAYSIAPKSDEPFQSEGKGCTLTGVDEHDPFGLVGQTLDGQFRVDKYVGEGGFSVVYKGHHVGLDAPVALKCLKLPSALQASLVDSFVQRFRDESRLYYQLSQGNLSIVRSISSGTTTIPATGAVLPYMVLEWLEGRSLAQDFELRRTTGLEGRTLDDAFELFSGAADGLGYAHAQGVVHRDMNPGNIFIIEEKGQTKTKVLDFGVAKILRDHTLELGARAQTLGSIRIFAPAYGAPEQFDDRVGEVGPWTDIYGFSLMLLESMMGEPVTHGEHIGDFARGALDEERRPTPRTLGLTVPDEIEQVFVRSFKINPKERWQNAQDFWVVFRNAIRMARHKGFNALSTVPLSMGFLKGQIDQGKANKEKLQKTLAMAAPPIALPPAAPILSASASSAPVTASPATIAGIGAVPAAPTTHRLKAQSSPGLNSTIAMAQRPSGLPAAPAPAQHAPTNARTNPVDDPSARPSYDPPAPPKSNGGLIAVLVVVAVLALFAIVGGAVAFMKLGRAAKVNPNLAVSVSATGGTPIYVPSALAPTPATLSGDVTTPSATPSAAVAIESPTAQPSATPNTTTATSPTSTPTTQPTEHPTTHPSAAPPPSAAPVDPNAFNEKAARGKLDTYGGMIGGACHEGSGVSGPGSATVTFGPDGKIIQLTVNPPYAGTTQATCVQKLLTHAAAPPFVGAPVTITYKFSVAK